MKETIKVVPFVPRKDYRNDALNTDFYEFIMVNGLFKLGFKDTQLVFDCFFRKNPGAKGKESGYSISAGQEQLTEFLLSYHFDEIACQYLLTKGMDEEFVKYLSRYKWKGTMNFNSLITTKATKIVRAADNDGNVMEFGGRRAQGQSASLYGARSAILGGCSGTANCLSEIVFGSPVNAVGTVAHAWIEMFPTEWEAFKAFADVYPEKVSLLIDTYSIFGSGVVNINMEK